MAGRVQHAVAVVAVAVASWIAWDALGRPPGHDITVPAIRWSAVLAAGLWAWAAVLGLRWRTGGSARVAATAGVVAHLLHVAVAFHAGHGWSHAAAVAHVRASSGFGAGVWVSHLFAAVWAADVAWWWLAATGYAARPPWVGRTVHGFLAFVVFNATVVFGTTPVRIAFGGVFVVLIVMWLRKSSPVATGGLSPHAYSTSGSGSRSRHT